MVWAGFVILITTTLFAVCTNRRFYKKIALDFEVNIQKVADEYESSAAFMLGYRF